MLSSYCHLTDLVLNANTLRYVPQIDQLVYYHCQLQSLGFGKFKRPQTSLPLPLLSNPGAVHLQIIRCPEAHTLIVELLNYLYGCLHRLI